MCLIVVFNCRGGCNVNDTLTLRCVSKLLIQEEPPCKVTIELPSNSIKHICFHCYCESVPDYNNRLNKILRDAEIRLQLTKLCIELVDLVGYNIIL